ncbi:MAG: FHA domain-containing protein [Hyphomicrobiaceae bacterium]
MATPRIAGIRPALSPLTALMVAGPAVAAVLWFAVSPVIAEHPGGVAGAFLSAAAMLADAIHVIVDRAVAWTVQGFETHPVAVSAVAGGASVPVLAIVVGISRYLNRRREIAAILQRQHPEPAPARHSLPASLRLTGNEACEPTELAQLNRVGAGVDCDIRLANFGLSDFHAIVWRNDDYQYEILDVSDAGDGAIVVNGRPVRRSHLADGDIVEMGGARFEFYQRLPAKPIVEPHSAATNKAHAGHIDSSPALADGRSTDVEGPAALQ